MVDSQLSPVFIECIMINSFRSAYVFCLYMHMCSLACRFLGKLLRINTGDGEVLYFEAPRGRQQYVTAEAAANVEWASWTCVLGSECQRVWPPASDITDVNTAHVIQNSSTIATGDDFGCEASHQRYAKYVMSFNLYIRTWQKMQIASIIYHHSRKNLNL